MKTPENVRFELAALLREHVDEYAHYATLWFDKHYPDLAVKQMADFADRLEWSRSLVLALSYGLESGAVIRDEVGFLVNVVGEPEFSGLVNAIVIQMNVMREIAPLIMRSCSSQLAKAQEYYDCLDEYLREYVLAKLSEFAQDVSTERWFSRRWDVVVDADLLAATHQDMGTHESANFSGSGGQSHAHSDAHAAPSAQNEEAFQILSRRERQVYVLLLEGKSNGEISAALNVSQNTVKTHVSRVFDKLNVNSRIELLRKALSA